MWIFMIGYITHSKVIAALPAYIKKEPPSPVKAMEAKESRTRTRAAKLALMRVSLISHWTWE